MFLASVVLAIAGSLLLIEGEATDGRTFTVAAVLVLVASLVLVARDLLATDPGAGEGASGADRVGRDLVGPGHPALEVGPGEHGREPVDGPLEVAEPPAPEPP
jgi:hypothetical protein